MKISKKQIRSCGVDIEIWSNWSDAKIIISSTDEMIPATVCHIHMKVNEQMTVDLRYLEMHKLINNCIRRGMIKNVRVNKLTFNPKGKQ